MAHWKRGKTRRKKGITWGTPKRLQKNGHNPNSNPGIRKWPCKKLKGEHQFKLVKKEKYKWVKEWCLTHACKGCGKIFLEWFSIKKNSNDTKASSSKKSSED